MTDDEARAAAIGRIKNRQAFYANLGSYLIINAFLVAIWAFSGAGYFWPGWVMAAWGIGLLFHAWDVFGQRNVITEADIQREMQRGGDSVA